MISPRAGVILKSIVGQYIVRATPVASQSVTTDCKLGVCPATIRNEMVLLEDDEYINRPYASSGSIPLDKGYRYYVDSLSDIDLPSVEQRLINHQFHQVEREFEKWLSLAATIIAKFSQNMAVVTKPKPVDSQFKHAEFLSLEESLVLVVLVLQGARVKQQLITFDEMVTQAELTETANKLNDVYAGLTQQQILTKSRRFSYREQQLTNCLLEMMQAEDKQEYDEPYLDGWHFMLNQPEFADSHRVLSLMELVENRNLVKQITPSQSSEQGVRVVIGNENESEFIQEYSVVTSHYGLPKKAIGTVAVIGPTRMPYARAISTVNYLSSVLSTLITELYGRAPSDTDENVT